MNPLNSGIVDKVEDWKYSASSLHNTNPIPISSHILEKDLHFLMEDLSIWLNTKFSTQIYKKMQKELSDLNLACQELRIVLFSDAKQWRKAHGTFSKRNYQISI